MVAVESLLHETGNELEPFQVNDKNILQYREDEESRRVQARRDTGKLKIWEKKGQFQHKSRKKWIKSILQENEDNDEGKEGANVVKCNPEKKPVHQVIMDSIEKYLAGKGIQEQKESLPDFIAKKRELFLLQMSLNIKKEEIDKLDAKAKYMDETIQKSEKILEEDALRFDTFLKENDKKAQEACREAEKETKRKMEKIQEIKKLNQQLQAVQNAIDKYKDNLDECLQYKTFLDCLTPASWVQQEIEIKRERQRKRRNHRILQKQHQWKVEQEEKLALEQKARQEAIEIEKAKNPKRRARRKRNKDNDVPIPQPELPSMPDFDDEPLTSSDEDIPMYFHKPQQLRDIFSSMEEENLFLIQNAHEAEQSLDEMTSRFQDSKLEVQEKVDAMQEKINQLKHNIQMKRDDIKATKDNLEGKHLASQRQDEESMRILTKKVKEVYLHCGFNDAGSNPRTLFMLSEIEARLGDILARIENMPDHDFIRADKLKEKKRREAKRAQQQAEQERLQEERNRKVIERSMQSPKKHKGKKVRSCLSSFHVYFLSPEFDAYQQFDEPKVMYRSYVRKCQTVENNEDETTQDEIDEKRHLAE